MKPLSLRSHLLGLGAICIAMTWFSSVAVYGWLSGAIPHPGRTVALSILWLCILPFIMAKLVRLAMTRWRRHRLRIESDRRQTEIRQEGEARKIELSNRAAKERAERELAQEKRSDAEERARALRNYFRE